LELPKAVLAQAALDDRVLVAEHLLLVLSPKRKIPSTDRCDPDGHAIAAGTWACAKKARSAALLDELGKRERERDDISEELLAADGRGLDA
jgi:hypothetical protein